MVLYDPLEENIMEALDKIREYQIDYDTELHLNETLDNAFVSK